MGGAQPGQEIIEIAEHEGLQQQPLVDADQQAGQIVRRLIAAQLVRLLGGTDQLGQPVAELRQEALAPLPCRTGAGTLQLREQHPHQPAMA